MDNKQSRQANIELLRIISMVMIVAHHLSFYGCVEFDTMSISVNRLWSQLLMYGGHVGVDIFVLIGGYFMISSKTMKLVKIARLWLMMLFYSVLTYAIAVAFFGYSVSVKLLMIVVTPFLNEQWPFASAYLMLMVLSPFINILLNKISKSSYRLLLGVFAFVWVIIPTFTTFEVEGNYLLWMIALYSFAGYVRLYKEDFTKDSKFYICVAFICAILSFASAIVLDIIGLKVNVAAKYATHFSGMQHLNIVLWAICLFIGFVKLPSTKGIYDKAINMVASLMFGVYLLHEDFFSRKILWEVIFNNNEISKGAFYIIATIGEIVAIMLVGCVVEWLRINLLEKWYMKGVGSLLSKPQGKIDGCMKDA